MKKKLVRKMFRKCLCCDPPYISLRVKNHKKLLRPEFYDSGKETAQLIQKILATENKKRF